MTEAMLSTRELIDGLKHYRSIAKHTLLTASDQHNPEVCAKHARVRREVYRALMQVAQKHGPAVAIEEALRRYEVLPFTNGTADHEFVDLKAQECALENFFLMVGVPAKTRREARQKRPALHSMIS